MPDAPREATPAATVVLLRDGDDGLETLMLHKDSKVAFGGMWVFPGGKVDDADRAGDGDEAAARRAAAREALEECAQVVDAAGLVPFAFWMPPPEAPRRFATWFFLGRPDAGDVAIDDNEIRDHRWLEPRDVLALRDDGEVDLAPPTWVTLHDLAAVDDVDAALTLALARTGSIPRYETHWTVIDGGAVAMWDGDAGYETGDHDTPGPRHRLWMLERGWRLERD